MTCRTPARFSYANYRNSRWMRPAPPPSEIRTMKEAGDVEIVFHQGRYVTVRHA